MTCFESVERRRPLKSIKTHRRRQELQVRGVGSYAIGVCGVTSFYFFRQFYPPFNQTMVFMSLYRRVYGFLGL